jgi:hypothetical protein
MIMPTMSECRRLLDEFHLELQAQGIATPGEIEICGMFGDLMWSPLGEPCDVLERAKADPAFLVRAYTRHVALARIVDEIRFFAGRIQPGAPPWWWSGQDPARVAAVEAEPDCYEMGVLAGIADAVRFAHSYLTGTALEAVDMIRSRSAGVRYIKS